MRISSGTHSRPMGGPIHVGVDSFGRRRAKKGGDLPPPALGLGLRMKIGRMVAVGEGKQT